MLGNFTYSNPTKLYFGKEALDGLSKELDAYGKNVLFIYGGGSFNKFRKDFIAHNAKSENAASCI